MGAWDNTSHGNDHTHNYTDKYIQSYSNESVSKTLNAIKADLAIYPAPTMESYVGVTILAIENDITPNQDELNQALKYAIELKQTHEYMNSWIYPEKRLKELNKEIALIKRIIKHKTFLVANELN